MIQTKGLTKMFGAFKAVDGITLEVDEGRILALLGPNGAGKTTLIRMLCGILVPSGGTASVLGYDIVKESEALRRNIGYMSQKFSLYSDLTVDENLDFYGRVYGLKDKYLRSRKDRLYTELSFAEYRGTLVAELSGGIRQKVSFASANLHAPRLLFLDEPTSGIDPAARQNFWDMVYLMAKEGTTVVISTHYMDEAERADEVAMIVGGKLVGIGNPKDLCAGSARKTGRKTTLEDVFIEFAGGSAANG